MRTKVYFEYVVNKHATDNYICFDKEQIELYDYDNNTYILSYHSNETKSKKLSDIVRTSGYSKYYYVFFDM